MKQPIRIFYRWKYVSYGYRIYCKLFSTSDIVVLDFLQALITSVWTFQDIFGKWDGLITKNGAPSIARRPRLDFHNKIEVQIQKLCRVIIMCSKLWYSYVDVVKMCVCVWWGDFMFQSSNTFARTSYCKWLGSQLPQLVGTQHNALCRPTSFVGKSLVNIQGCFMSWSLSKTQP